MTLQILNSLSQSLNSTTAAGTADSQQIRSSSSSAYQNETLIHDPCARLPLTPELWKRLRLDEYLRTYPSGQNLTLEVFESPPPPLSISFDS